MLSLILIKKMSFTTLKIFDNAMDAHILKAAIEAEGISCYLFDENIVTINPLYNITVGGIKLAVADADFVAASTLLTTIESRPYLDDENNAVTCPSCHSTAIDMSVLALKSPWTIVSVLISLVSFIYPIHSKRVNRCKDCQTEFK
jgi:hypothetical protein